MLHCSTSPKHQTWKWALNLTQVGWCTLALMGRSYSFSCHAVKIAAHFCSISIFYICIHELHACTHRQSGFRGFWKPLLPPETSYWEFEMSLTHKLISVLARPLPKGIVPFGIPMCPLWSGVKTKYCPLLALCPLITSSNHLKCLTRQSFPECSCCSSSDLSVA